MLAMVGVRRKEGRGGAKEVEEGSGEGNDISGMEEEEGES